MGVGKKMACAAADPQLVEVAVAAPIDRTLTYRVPAILAAADGGGGLSLLGRRVLVPLTGRKVTGYILAAGGQSEGKYAIRDILDVLDRAPLFPVSLIPFFRWIAGYYHYPLGEVIKSALPAGLSPKSVKQLILTDLGRSQGVVQGVECTEGEGWLEDLHRKGQLSPSRTKELLAKKADRKQIEQLMAEGHARLHEAVVGDAVGEKTEMTYRLLHRMPDPVATGEEPEQFQAYRHQLKRELGLALKLSEAKTLYYLQGGQQREEGAALPRKELLHLYRGAATGIRSLIERRLVSEEKRRVFRSPLGEMLEYFPAPECLSQEQQQVLEEIVPAIEEKSYRPFLLHGVTGSGKTEVYLRATAACLDQGRSALIIVPEIALATQLEAHFVSRFGQQVVLLHSGLSRSERFDQWSLALAGEAKIVIGARSAIFAPFTDLGLIVVDEEHDSGLKQDDNLRYNGRDLAVVRARQQQAVVLLGSATPSVVSYHNALCGKYRLLTMAARVGERLLPKVTIIDLRKKEQGAKRSIFRPPLVRGLKNNLDHERQSVILINRRGFSSNVICQECGTPVQCRNCHVSLTLHRTEGKLICHYCGFSVHEKTVCESCGSTQLVPVGFGTERVESELRELFPDARIARLDTDTARDRTAFLQLLQSMRRGEIDILVGTQMIAKGHHFPKVTLVGVVWADGGLAIPDYRAAEKTFQLITQVTGRAGRGDEPGEVFIQTMRPEHYAIALARDHNYRQLVEKELALRKMPLFPPYVRLVVVHIQGDFEGEVETSATRVAEACRYVLRDSEQEGEVLGPAPSPLDKLKKKYRWQVMLKAASPDVLDGLCRYVRDHQQELVRGKCRVLLDRDPENML